MRNKLIAVGGFLLFIIFAWSYFKTPAPPVTGLTRPKIDPKVFAGVVAGQAVDNPASKAAADRAETRNKLLEQRKAIRGQGAGEAKSGFLSRLFSRNKPNDKEGGAGAAMPGSSATSPLNSLRANPPGLNQKNREFIERRREERKARRDALIGAVKTRPGGSQLGEPGPVGGAVGQDAPLIREPPDVIEEEPPPPQQQQQDAGGQPYQQEPGGEEK